MISPIWLKAIVSPLFLSVLTADVYAQSSEEDDLTLVYGDRSTVSIVTGSAQPLSRAPAVATVITAQEVQAMGVADLDEVLDTVPGLHVNRGSNLNNPLYVIRGVYSQYTPQVLVLQNGISLTTLFMGNKGNMWRGLALENIARIELIRGPGSALYGADAFSGVINIITKTASDIGGTKVGARVGSFQTYGAWLQHGGLLGDVAVASYLQVGHTDGHKGFVEADAQTRNDLVYGTRASLAPGKTNNQYDAVDAALDISYGRWRWRAGYKLRDKIGTGAGVAAALDPTTLVKGEWITSDVSWANPQIAPDWSSAVDIAYMGFKQRIPTHGWLFPPGTRFPTGIFPEGMIGAPETSERQVRVSGTATYTGFRGHQLRLGIGYDHLNLYEIQERKNFTFTPSGIPVPAGAVRDFTTIAPFLTPHKRILRYAYIQDVWKFAPDWTLTAGARHDHYSDIGSTTNPRLALVWDMSLNLTAKLLYGHAFRAPAFVELYSINNPVVRGNHQLRPETNRTLEAAFAWKAHRDALFNMNVFRYDMRDIIRTVPNVVSGTGSTYQNAGSQRGTGMEIEGTVDVRRDVRLSGHYSFQKSYDKATSRDAGYVPHHKLNIRGDWRFANGWAANAQVTHVADRVRASGDNRPSVSDYTTVDVAVRTDLAGSPWNITATMRNAFNADVRQPSLAPGLLVNDIPMAGRSLLLQATYRFE